MTRLNIKDLYTVVSPKELWKVYKMMYGAAVGALIQDYKS